ncbi:MAG: hypothetical protein RIR34_798 [Actinomycetota bacterium]|jgi:hypothetical protein
MAKETETVEVRRAPKYFPFLLSGGAVGLVLGLIAFFATGQENSPEGTSVLGLMVLFPSAILAFAGVVVAWVVDRKSVASAKRVTATKLEL